MIISPQASMDDFDAVTAVNFRGVFLCYQLAAKQMIKEGHGGRIIGEASNLPMWSQKLTHFTVMD